MKKVEIYKLKINIQKLKPYIKMDEKCTKFDYIETEEYEFHQHKNLISRSDIDINKLLISNKHPFGKKDFKYLIGYKDVEKIRPLCIFNPKMSLCKRDFDKTRCMYFD